MRTRPRPPVVGLDVCSPGPNCNYGPIYNTYSNYGNVAPADLGDCAFAAVADWEQIVLGLHPDPTLIGYEFAQAGGTADGGLSISGLINYWLTSGINSVPLVGFHAYPVDRTDVESNVLEDKALLVDFQFQDGEGFGPYSVSAGGHMAVVDGFTPEGPLVVSWGHTLQLTWAQWDSEAVATYGVSTSADSALGPGLTLTAPSTSSSYQVAECWTQYSGGAWSDVTDTAETASFSGNDILARGPQNFWGVVRLAGTPSSTVSGATVTLIQPNGTPWGPSVLTAGQYTGWSTTFDWTWSDASLFFQHPELAGQGTWMFRWSFPDGQTCLSLFTVQ